MISSEVSGHKSHNVLRCCSVISNRTPNASLCLHRPAPSAMRDSRRRLCDQCGRPDRSASRSRNAPRRHQGVLFRCLLTAHSGHTHPKTAPNRSSGVLLSVFHRDFALRSPRTTAPGRSDRLLPTHSRSSHDRTGRPIPDFQTAEQWPFGVELFTPFDRGEKTAWKRLQPPPVNGPKPVFCLKAVVRARGLMHRSPGLALRAGQRQI